jgi:hypothetical protein
LRGLFVQAPPLDEDVLRIVGEVNKKRKGGRDEDSMGEILFKISENFHKFKQVRPRARSRINLPEPLSKLFMLHLISEIIGAGAV